MKAQPDMITTLPQPIIESILCCLPIEEAAKTSILSRAWRYKWTTIPELVFNMSSIVPNWAQRNLLTDSEQESSDLEQESDMLNDMMRCKFFYAIHQVLLLHQGPIHEFALHVKTVLSGFEIDQIILHLSRNHRVKKLTLDLSCDDSYKLPLSVFSLHHLTDLSLKACTIYHKPSFNEFGSLTNLFLKNVIMSKMTLLHLLSNCPSLTRLYLLMYDLHQQLTIAELFKCSPLMEHLTVFSFLIREFASDLVQLPTFIHLKYFCAIGMGFAYPHDLYWLALLIKCSPNLEKIKLWVCFLNGYDDEHDDKATCHILKEYSDVRLEHLKKLKIVEFRNFKAELELVKIIMAKSPNLKEVKFTHVLIDKKQRLGLLKVLSGIPCASRVLITID